MNRKSIVKQYEKVVTLCLYFFLSFLALSVLRFLSLLYRFVRFFPSSFRKGKIHLLNVEVNEKNHDKSNLNETTYGMVALKAIQVIIMPLSLHILLRTFDMGLKSSCLLCLKTKHKWRNIRRQWSIIILSWLSINANQRTFVYIKKIQYGSYKLFPCH